MTHKVYVTSQPGATPDRGWVARRVLPLARASWRRVSREAARVRAQRYDATQLTAQASGRLCEAKAAGALHVLNAPSPAATASLAIGEEVAARVIALIHER